MKVKPQARPETHLVSWVVLSAGLFGLTCILDMHQGLFKWVLMGVVATATVGSFYLVNHWISKRKVSSGRAKQQDQQMDDPA
jgi:hypothetical protein